MWQRSESGYFVFIKYWKKRQKQKTLNSPSASTLVVCEVWDRCARMCSLAKQSKHPANRDVTNIIAKFSGKCRSYVAIAEQYAREC